VEWKQHTRHPRQPEPVPRNPDTGELVGCEIRCELVPGLGYRLTCSKCNASVSFGVSETLDPSKLPSELGPGCRGICRKEILAAFGPGGSRMLPAEEAYDPSFGLGRKPGSQAGQF